MQTLLEVRGLSVSFPLSRGPLTMLSSSAPSALNVVREIDLDVDRAETLGLVGESGSGKTTVIRALNGLIARDGGSVQFDGRPLAGTDRAYRAARREMAMLFQDPLSSLSPRMIVRSLLLEPFRIHGIELLDRDAKVGELLAQVGLGAEIARRYPHELSGGQARRVGVARALALQPKLILADEPTAGLDVSVQGQVLNLLLRLQRDMGVSYVIVTHDLAVVRHVAHRVAIMYLGRIVETGSSADIFRAPRHPYTRVLLDSEPIPDPRRRRPDAPITGEIPSLLHRPPGCAFSSRCPRVQERCRHDDPAPRALSPGRTARCHFPLEASDAPANGVEALHPEPRIAASGAQSLPEKEERR